MAPEIIYGIGAIVLLAVLTYGTAQYRNRNRALDPLRDQKTREQYGRGDPSQSS